MEKIVLAGIDLIGGQGYAGAEELGQYQFVTRLRAGARDELQRMEETCDNKAKLEFGVTHGMTARGDGSGGLQALSPAARHFTQPDGEAVDVIRIPYQVHGGTRRGAQSVKAAQRLGGANLADHEGHVDGRR